MLRRIRGKSSSAIKEIDLLPEVADHKNTYYRQAWARYDLAREPNTLELMLHENIIVTIQKDYEEMQEMMFGESPSFDEILDRLQKLKQKITALE